MDEDDHQFNLNNLLTTNEHHHHQRIVKTTKASFHKTTDLRKNMILSTKGLLPRWLVVTNSNKIKVLPCMAEAPVENVSQAGHDKSYVIQMHHTLQFPFLLRKNYYEEDTIGE